MLEAKKQKQPEEQEQQLLVPRFNMEQFRSARLEEYSFVAEDLEKKSGEELKEFAGRAINGIVALKGKYSVLEKFNEHGLRQHFDEFTGLTKSQMEEKKFAVSLLEALSHLLTKIDKDEKRDDTQKNNLITSLSQYTIWECLPGIITKLQGMNIVLRGEGLKATVARAKEDVVQALCMSFISGKETKKTVSDMKLIVSSGNEVHNVAALRNLVAEKFGTEEVTQDRYATITGSNEAKNDFVKYMESKISSPGSVHALLDQIGAKVEEQLPEKYTVDEPLKALFGRILGVNGTYTGSLFKLGDDYNMSYKPERDKIIRAIVADKLCEEKYIQDAMLQSVNKSFRLISVGDEQYVGYTTIEDTDRNDAANSYVYDVLLDVQAVKARAPELAKKMREALNSAKTEKNLGDVLKNVRTSVLDLIPNQEEKEAYKELIKKNGLSTNSLVLSDVIQKYELKAADINELTQDEIDALTSNTAVLLYNHNTEFRDLKTFLKTEPAKSKLLMSNYDSIKLLFENGAKFQDLSLITLETIKLFIENAAAVKALVESDATKFPELIKLTQDELKKKIGDVNKLLPLMKVSGFTFQKLAELDEKITDRLTEKIEAVKDIIELGYIPFDDFIKLETGKIFMLTEYFGEVQFLLHTFNTSFSNLAKNFSSEQIGNMLTMVSHYSDDVQLLATLGISLKEWVQAKEKLYIITTNAQEIGVVIGKGVTTFAKLTSLPKKQIEVLISEEALVAYEKGITFQYLKYCGTKEEPLRYDPPGTPAEQFNKCTKKILEVFLNKEKDGKKSSKKRFIKETVDLLEQICKQRGSTLIYPDDDKGRGEIQAELAKIFVEAKKAANVEVQTVHQQSFVERVKIVASTTLSSVSPKLYVDRVLRACQRRAQAVETVGAKWIREHIAFVRQRSR
ncbi:hypothetical protein MIDIC_230006 [Alphaproteobacteria bacterium]